MRPGKVFENSEVVDLYKYRPSYPDALYTYLLNAVSHTGHLLDIGCGQGKICRKLAGKFGTVAAIDPSAHMISEGKTLPGGDAPNLSWTKVMAEEYTLEGPRIDVATAALSLHWIDQDFLLPRLAAQMTDDHVFAHIAGDHAYDPPWASDWRVFLAKWVRDLTGRTLIYKNPATFWEGHNRYAQVTDKKQFISAPIHQSLEEYILCEHSRDTFAASKLGDKLAAFDNELSEILSPHVSQNGMLEFQVETSLTLARLSQ